MRFLLLNQFYPPDPAPTGQYLQDLARVLVERGHEVKVLCSRRSYDGRQTYPGQTNENGVQVCRLAATGFGRRGFVGKLMDYGSFSASLAATLLFRSWRPDLILSLTTPPYLGLFGKIAARRHKCRHATWVMDLYPDILFAHGMAQKNGVSYGALERLTRYQLRGSHAIVALGPTMAERVSRYVQGNVSWLPLWSDAGLSPWTEAEIPIRSERGWRRDELVLLYSGNMGLGHRFSEFLQAAKKLRKNGPRWVFCGGGKRRAEIEQFVSSDCDSRVELLDYAPKTRLREHLCAADVHLMSMDEGWQGFMVPSKLQASFAVGRAVIYVGGQNCETARWIRESGGGWVVDQDDVAGLLEAVHSASNFEERQRRGAAARRFAELRFNKAAICNQLALLIESAAPSPATPESNPAGPTPTSANWSMVSGP